MYNVGWATLNIFASIIIGAFAFVYCAYNFPNVINEMFGIASGIKGFITEDSRGIPVSYNIWIKFLLQDEQFVFMFFVILARVLMASIATAFKSLFS